MRAWLMLVPSLAVVLAVCLASHTAAQEEKPANDKPANDKPALEKVAPAGAPPVNPRVELPAAQVVEGQQRVGIALPAVRLVPAMPGALNRKLDFHLICLIWCSRSSTRAPKARS